VTDAATGVTVWAIVGDFAADHPEGEISEAVAAQLGIQFYANSYTLGVNYISINYYAGSRGK
jgi:hypothetical protein